MSVLLFVVLGMLGMWSLVTGVVLVLGPTLVLAKELVHREKGGRP